MVPAATFVEPLTESIVAGLMALLAFRYFLFPLFLEPADSTASFDTTWTLASLLFLLLHFTLWHQVDLQVLAALNGGTPLPSHERWTFLRAWCLRELLALPIWAWAMAGSTVEWRGRRYRILKDGRAAVAHEKRTFGSGPIGSSGSGAASWRPMNINGSRIDEEEGLMGEQGLYRKVGPTD